MRCQIIHRRVNEAVVSQYLAGAFLNLLKWWLEAEMPLLPSMRFFSRISNEDPTKMSYTKASQDKTHPTTEKRLTTTYPEDILEVQLPSQAALPMNRSRQKLQQLLLNMNKETPSC